MTSLILLSDWQASQVEFWRPILGWPYDVSNLGRLRVWRWRVKNGRRKTRHKVREAQLVNVRPSGRAGGGYVRANLYDGCGNSVGILLHRVVAQAFLANPGNLPVVNHKNCIRADNRVDNLEFTTQQKNIQHSMAFRKKYMWVRQDDYEYLKSRITELETQLQSERTENRKAERHWSNQFLRKANSYPLTAEPKPTAELPPAVVVPAYDAGELEALETEAVRLGLTREQAREFFAREKQIDPQLLM